MLDLLNDLGQFLFEVILWALAFALAPFCIPAVIGMVVGAATGCIREAKEYFSVFWKNLKLKK